METSQDPSQVTSFPEANEPQDPNRLPSPARAEAAMADKRQISSSETPSSHSQDAEKPPINPWMDPKSFPDGGAKAWLAVAGSSACLFVSFGWVNCIGVFQDYYQTHQLREYSPSQIAWIPSLQIFFMLAGGPFVGKVFDDYGPHHLLFAGTFFHVFGLMMTSLSKKYYQFLLSQAVCSAIGASCVFYPAFTCVWHRPLFPDALDLLNPRSQPGSSIREAPPWALSQQAPLWGALSFL
jgi:hypothetical protein